MRKIIFLFFTVFLFVCCSKEEKNSTVTIVKQWEIELNEPLRYRQGFIYKDTYLLWTIDRGLMCYDLNTKELLWEEKFILEDNFAAGGHLAMMGDYFVFHTPHWGFSVFDLENKELILYERPTFNTWSPPFVFEDYIYYNYFEHYNNEHIIIEAFNLKTKETELIYEMYKTDGLYVKLSPPVVYRDNEGSINYLMLQQTSVSGGFNHGTSILMSVNKNKEINWLDTLESEMTKLNSETRFLPIILDDNAIVHDKEKLYSYNLFTGEKNWGIDTEISLHSNVIEKNGFIYIDAAEDFRYLKIDPANGETIWESSTLSPVIFPFTFYNSQFTYNTFLDFEIYENRIIVSNEKFSGLYAFSDETGDLLEFANQFEFGISNPVYYVEKDMFVAHYDNGIVGFELK